MAYNADTGAQSTNELGQYKYCGENDNDCSDANTSAGSRTGAFAGVANWRVPSIDELYSLADKSRASAPFINPIFFPGTASKKYRSSTPDPQDSVQAKVADFNEGNITAYQKLDFFTYYTRCVASP